MDRRSFLQMCAAALAATAIPKVPVGRVYSFAAPWMAEQAAFERAVATRLVDGGVWHVHRPVDLPEYTIIRNARLFVHDTAVLNCNGMVHLIGNWVDPVRGWRPPDGYPSPGSVITTPLGPRTVS